MNEVSPKILKTVQTLAQIAAELHQGKHFKPTFRRSSIQYLRGFRRGRGAGHRP